LENAVACRPELTSENQPCHNLGLARLECEQRLTKPRPLGQFWKVQVGNFSQAPKLQAPNHLFGSTDRGVRRNSSPHLRSSDRTRSPSPWPDSLADEGAPSASGAEAEFLTTPALKRLEPSLGFDPALPGPTRRLRHEAKLAHRFARHSRFTLSVFVTCTQAHSYYK
jgi:hypothetical protein